MSFHTIWVEGDGAKVGIKHGELYAINGRIQMGLNTLKIVADPEMNGRMSQTFFNIQHSLATLHVKGDSSVRVETGAVLASHFSIRAKNGNVSVEQSPEHMLQVYAKGAVVWLRNPVLSATIIATNKSKILGTLVVKNLTIHVSEQSTANITVMHDAKVSQFERDDSTIELKYQL